MPRNVSPPTNGHPTAPSMACTKALPLTLLALVALVLLLLPGGASAMEFEEEPVPIPSESTGVQSGVAMASGPEDMLYAVWEDGRWTTFQQGVALLFAWSEPDERGRAWSDEVRLPAGDARNDMASPAISVGPDGAIHVVWQELQRVDAVPGGPYWEVRYAVSTDNGMSWESLRLSQPNNRNNTRPDVAALAGASAYVAWDLEDHPGSSIALAKVDQGSRVWIREDFAEASEDWEVNGHVSLGVDGGGTVHAAWHAMDMNGMWEVQASQVLYRAVEGPSRDSVLPDPVGLADRWTNVTNTGPTLAVTKRHGTWVAWVQTGSPVVVDAGVQFLSDRVVEGVPGVDILVAEARAADGLTPSASISTGPEDGVVVALSGVGNPPRVPLFTMSCSAQGCFDPTSPVVPGGIPAAARATVTMDKLENVYVGWDDGKDVWCTQRANNPPGPPGLLHPEGSTNDENLEFVWSFNDVDAGAYQSGFEIMYSQDPLFPPSATEGGVVLGVQGRASRYLAPEPLGEGRWYWTVATRDQLGLWSEPSPAGTFLADRTPPMGRVVINGGDEFTSERVVVLTLNATDNLEGMGGTLYFQISSDPNFPNASRHEWPPPNNQVNQELPPGEGVKVVFFRIIDASGLTHTSLDHIVYNATPILIVHIPIETAPAAKPLNVSCDIMRGTNVEVSLFYKRTFDDDFFEIQMDSNGTHYWGEIPRDRVSLRGLQYFITARAPGVTVTSPATNPAEEPYEIEVYETTDVYQPPIYNPILTFTGALVVLVALVLIWWYRLREQ